MRRLATTGHRKQKGRLNAERSGMSCASLMSFEGIWVPNPMGPKLMVKCPFFWIFDVFFLGSNWAAVGVHGGNWTLSISGASKWMRWMQGFNDLTCASIQILLEQICLPKTSEDWENWYRGTLQKCWRWFKNVNDESHWARLDQGWWSGDTIGISS
jgi:hypothetical protein